VGRLSVRLSVAGAETETAAVRSAGTADFRGAAYIFFADEADALVAELVDAGSKAVQGRLVVRVVDVAAAGSQVRWLRLMHPGTGEHVGELQLVLQYMDAPAAEGEGAGGLGFIPLALLVAGASAVSALLQRRQERAAPRWHEVREGDTLSAIGRRAGVEVDDIRARNRGVVVDPDLIYPGTRLRLR